MAGHTIGILGNPASGKTFSLRNLNPSKTLISTASDKRLPWKNSSADYSKEKNNLVTISNFGELKQLLQMFSKSALTTLVIDDYNYLGSFEELNRINEVGYKKYSEIANNISYLFKDGKKLLRDNQVCIILSHVEDGENGTLRMKTTGRMVREKIVPEGLIDIILFADIITNDNGEKEHVFHTRANGTILARTPHEMFETDVIPNDMKIVLEKIFQYYG